MNKTKKICALFISMVMVLAYVTVFNSPVVAKAGIIMGDACPYVTVGDELYPEDTIYNEGTQNISLITYQSVISDIGADAVTIGGTPLYGPGETMTIPVPEDGGYKWRVIGDDLTKMIVSVYHISVGGVEITADNKYDVLEDGGSVKYNWKENKLTLNNANITSIEYYMSKDLTIELVGDNIINAPIGFEALDSGAGADVTITGTGSLKLNGFSYIEDGSLIVDGASVVSETMVIEDDLTIKNNASLDVNCSVNGSSLVVRDGTITVESGSLKAANDDGNGILAHNVAITGGTVSSSSKYYGIIVDDTLNISGGDVDFDGDEGAISSFIEAGAKVNITGGNINLTGGRCALDVNILNVSGGTVTSEGVLDGMLANDITISGGSVTSNVAGISSSDCAVYAYNELKITGGTLVVNAPGCMPLFAHIITLDGVTVVTPEGGVVADSGYPIARTYYTIKDTDGSIPSNVKIAGTCKVTFDANGGKFADSETTKVVISDLDGKVTFPAAPVNSNKGAFKGWYTAAEGGTVVEASKVFTENITLYAQYEEPAVDPEPITYDIEGKNQSIHKNEEKELTFRSLADFSKFINVMVDGEVIDASNYTASEGSTVIVLKVAYLKNLAVGTHKITINSNDGKAETTFEVLPAIESKPTQPSANAPTQPSASTPRTGDVSPAGFVAVMLGLLGLGFVGFAFKKRKN